LATLFLSQGVPMLLAGDELGRTQSGNNNAYCQDNTISWVDWQLERENEFLLDFTAQLARLRRRHPIFRRRKFFAGGSVPESGGLDDIVWLRNTGEQMSDEDWASGFARTVGVFLNGRGIPSPDPRGQRVIDDSFMLCFNAHWEDVPFTLPPEDYGQSWEAVVNTAAPLAEFAVERSFKPLDVVDVDARAVLVLRRVF